MSLISLERKSRVEIGHLGGYLEKEHVLDLCHQFAPDYTQGRYLTELEESVKMLSRLSAGTTLKYEWPTSNEQTL